MRTSFRTIISVAALTAFAGCGHPTEPTRSTAATTPSPAGPSITAPPVDAGPDTWVPLPANSMRLEGFVSTPLAIAGNYSWRKISGPASYTLQSPTSQFTNLNDLEEGIYEFEFALTINGSTSSDTVKIHVYDPRVPSANEVILRNVQWNCPMGCNATPVGFQLAGRTPARVRLKSSDAEVWVEVKHDSQWTAADKYVYTTTAGHFWVYSDNADGRVDIWIVF